MDPATEEDRSSSRPQRLEEHHQWAGDRARALTQRLDIAPPLAGLIELAARLHDEGKRAKRWQQAFNAPADGPYAKTRGPISVNALSGYRHEFGSLPYAERDERFLDLEPQDQDLVLHLIASPHGFARPFLRTDGCEDAPPSVLAQRARDTANRFFRLQDRFGPWGLAYLETLHRSADQQASRDNDAGRERGGE